MADLPEDVERFIADHVDNIEQLEILLLLRSQPSREFSPRDVTTELRLGSESAATRLRDLAERGFFETHADPPRYRYAPDHGDKERAISRLAHCYADRRVAVITQIFSPRNDAIRSFADAFKLRRR